MSLQGWSVSQQNSQTVIGNASGSIQLLSLNNFPSLKLTWHLKMDGWNTSFLLGWMKFSWAMFVSGRVPWSISKIFKPRMPCLELASYIRTPFRDRWKGLAQSCQANSFDKKQVTNNFFQVIQSDPFYTLVGGHQKPLKGSLNHPKRLTKNSQVCALLMYFSWRPSGQFSCLFFPKWMLARQNRSQRNAKLVVILLSHIPVLTSQLAAQENFEIIPIPSPLTQ